MIKLMYKGMLLDDKRDRVSVFIPYTSIVKVTHYNGYVEIYTSKDKEATSHKDSDSVFFNQLVALLNSGA